MAEWLENRRTVFRRVRSAAQFDAVWEILAPSVGNPDDAAQAHLRVQYQQRPEHELRALLIDGQVVGVIGLRLGSAGMGEISRISVSAPHRMRGGDRAMIGRLWALREEVRSWVAETDDDAVGFYRSLGFMVDDLGELYPRVRRYRCTLHRPGFPASSHP